MKSTAIHREAEILRLEYRALLLRAEGDPDGGVARPANFRQIRCAARDRRRRRSLLRPAPVRTIGDDAFHQLEEEFDWAELSAQG